MWRKSGTNRFDCALLGRGDISVAASPKTSGSMAFRGRSRAGQDRLSLIVWRAGTDDHAVTDDRVGSPAHRRGQDRTRPSPADAFADLQLAG
jgi:hypothetical protein